MADVTVSQLAETVGAPVDRLLQQMQEADLPQSKADDVVSESQKQTLLAYIKKSHGETSGSPKKITLKRRTLSTLKTGGSAGRGRTINVEVRKKRTYVRRAETEEAPEAPVAEVEESIVDAPVIKAVDDEALRKAAHAEKEAEEAKLKEDAAQRAAELEEQKAKAEEELRKQEEAKKPVTPAENAATETSVSSRKDKRDRSDLDDADDKKKKRAKHAGKQRRAKDIVDVGEDLSVLTETAEIDAKAETATLGLSSARPKRAASRPSGPKHKFQAPTEDIRREVELGESITVAQLSQKTSVKAAEVIKILMNLGVMANINQTIDQETATLVVEELGHEVKLLDADAVEKNLEAEMALEGEAETRAPVVTVMGHVDHGKTSLLDFVRKAGVAGGEAGGITQHIGAYRVNTDQGEICFIDTPGHAAFTAMRARGAQSTDIVILVVAADDGVMPQTEEAIQHAKDAEVPLVVAINKMDKEGADPDRVKNELSARNVIPEDWGGDTQFIPVSAITGEGVESLLEAVLLQAELLELTAVHEGPARGVVVESELDKGRGPVATLLVQNGTLSRGDIIVAGEYYGRVRAINDEHNNQVKSAGPATPVAILGLGGTPAAGDPFLVAKDEKKAREVAEFRKEKATSERLATPAASLDTLLESFGASEINYLNVVVKADVRGSLEAIVSALRDLGNDEVKVSVVFSGVGGITESDVNLALTSGAVIFGFNVRADNSARRVVELEGLDLRYYKVIYDLVDDVKAALSGMLSPEVREDIVGIAEVRDVFESKKFGNIAGCMVIEGTVSRSKKIRVLRENVVIYEGELESLRHFKSEVEEAKNGTECGIGVKNYNDVKVKDQIEVFDTREVARVL
ncbi:translation initiation factor IF-2 [Pseudomonadales bacterium]|jgi:translation initiation factor IF-2|nr:translation initiation factor IF-2 [Pseudomonadales bacterium]MDC1018068.1 translation initiation factor IF-2 [Pseudomonadales bacterium]|tara:strand:- start:6515 stop:9097 length:2583 start_codon:yes stop_codon:yes gene_type:complete